LTDSFRNGHIVRGTICLDGHDRAKWQHEEEVWRQSLDAKLDNPSNLDFLLEALPASLARHRRQ
jgi:hypothetical protein